MSTDVVDAIRTMIVIGELRPRQHVRQDELAERLMVSKIPLREALHTLVGERVIEHHPRRGFFITDLSTNSLRQLYRMRELLESEVLSSLPIPNSVVTKRLREINRDIGRATGEDGVATVVDLNREFHFLIFDMSDQELLVAEVKRLWAMSEQYRAVYLWNEQARRRVHQDHTAIIKAITAGDTSALLAASNRHRSAAMDSIGGGVLPRRATRTESSRAARA